ncbi:MAG TPA: hypothetical protein VFC01_22695 [Mycobacterium sp.]|nr:hypothetical protein [Mycobacterium sp.]
MTAIDWPTGATEVSDWADVGHPDEFRSFLGPKWTLPGIRWVWGDNDEDGFVTVSGTQLRDGTVEGRCPWPTQLPKAVPTPSAATSPPTTGSHSTRSTRTS